MKTLVIHPKDVSTDFLDVIYQNKDWTIITDPRISKKQLVNAIKSHDRIVLLGHGTEYGLIALSQDRKNFRFLIDSQLVYLLRTKELVGIWCNADKFFNKYQLKGFYTGMIVSEYEEALWFNLNTRLDLIEESNHLFARSIHETIDQSDMLQQMQLKYDAQHNPIIDFNKQNLYIA